MSSTQIFSTSSNLPTPTPSSVEPLLNSFPPSSSLSTQPQPHHHSHLNLHPQSQSPRSSSESESLLRDHPSSSSHNKHDFLRSHSRSQKLNSHTLRWVLAITGLGAAIYLLFGSRLLFLFFVLFLISSACVYDFLLTYVICFLQSSGPLIANSLARFNLSLNTSRLLINV